MFDGKAFGAEVVAAVRGYVDQGFVDVAVRLKELEDRKAERGEPGERGLDGAPGRDGVDGAPGADGKDGERGPEGVGREGPPGRDGRDGAAGRDGERGQDGKDGAAGLPGRDGVDGKDGRDGVDGLGFDHMELAHDGERDFVFRFSQGGRVKEFPFQIPVVLDRGVYAAERAYLKGDAVTWGGSLWIAQQDTRAKPETGPEWRLAVKRGRDGRDAKP
jgi:hypothetical protein